MRAACNVPACERVALPRRKTCGAHSEQRTAHLKTLWHGGPLLPEYPRLDLYMVAGLREINKPVRQHRHGVA